MPKLFRRLDRGPLGTGCDRNPDIAPGERIERVRYRLDLRSASPEWIVKDAEGARTRTPELIAARYLGVSVGYHVFARPT
jgi:hypothetical protein